MTNIQQTATTLLLYFKISNSSKSKSTNNRPQPRGTRYPFPPSYIYPPDSSPLHSATVHTVENPSSPSFLLYTRSPHTHTYSTRTYSALLSSSGSQGSRAHEPPPPPLFLLSSSFCCCYASRGNGYTLQIQIASLPRLMTRLMCIMMYDGERGIAFSTQRDMEERVSS